MGAFTVAPLLFMASRRVDVQTHTYVSLSCGERLILCVLILEGKQSIEIGSRGNIVD